MCTESVARPASALLDAPRPSSPPKIMTSFARSNSCSVSRCPSLREAHQQRIDRTGPTGMNHIAEEADFHQGRYILNERTVRVTVRMARHSYPHQSRQKETIAV